MSLDRLLALILGLRYRQIVTLRRSFIVVSVLWFASTFVATMYVWNPSIAEWCTYIFVPLCLVTSIFSYSKIYLTVNHQQIQVQEHQGRAIPLNVARYKRAVNSALWLQLALIACYLPYNIARALWTKRGLSPDGFIAKDFALSLLYVNSTINPFLYCWKIREVRQAVKDMIRQLLCSPSLSI